MKNSLAAPTVALLIALLAGCGGPRDEANTTADPDSPIVMDETPPALHQAHPEHGPHGGELVELGEEAFHVEIVHGGEDVALYVLDGAAAEPVAIEAAAITVSLKREDQVRSFEVAADPQPGDAAGSASRFTSTEPELGQWLDAHAEGVVVVRTEGKSFTGAIEHDHDHQH